MNQSASKLSVASNQQTPANQYKRAPETGQVDTLRPVAAQSSGDQRSTAASPVKTSVTGKMAKPVMKAQQQQLSEKLSAPMGRKQRGQGVTQAGLRQNEQTPVVSASSTMMKPATSNTGAISATKPANNTAQSFTRK